MRYWREELPSGEWGDYIGECLTFWEVRELKSIYDGRVHHIGDPFTEKDKTPDTETIWQVARGFSWDSSPECVGRAVIVAREMTPNQTRLVFWDCCDRRDPADQYCIGSVFREFMHWLLNAIELEIGKEGTKPEAGRGAVSGEEMDQQAEKLTWLERQYLTTVERLYEQGSSLSDEQVRMSIINPRTGQPYCRKTILGTRHGLEDKGYSIVGRPS